ncbi:MAG: hypothetical protein FJ029_00765 [Actinobacteria bacterium]|nr:hypothetical protein [Actinomycetota bacterium]
MRRRIARGLAILLSGVALSAFVAACGGEFEFKPAGEGRGQGAVFNEAPKPLYATPTPTKGA